MLVLAIHVVRAWRRGEIADVDVSTREHPASPSTRREPRRERNGDPGTAARAIVIATVSNTAVKAGMVAVLGSAALRKPVFIAAAAMIVAGVGTVMAF